MVPTVILWIAGLLVAEIWALRAAFRERAAWGLLVLLLPSMGVNHAIIPREG